MSEEEEPPLTEEEQQLLNDMCKRLDEMRIQSIRHAEEQTKRFAAMQDTLGAIHKHLNEIQVHGYNLYSPNTPLTPSVHLANLDQPKLLDNLDKPLGNFVEHLEGKKSEKADVEVLYDIDFSLEKKDHEVEKTLIKPLSDVELSLGMVLHSSCRNGVEDKQFMCLSCDDNSRVWESGDSRVRLEGRPSPKIYVESMYHVNFSVFEENKEDTTKWVKSSDDAKLSFSSIDVADVICFASLSWAERVWEPGGLMCVMEERRWLRKVKCTSLFISSCDNQVWKPGGLIWKKLESYLWFISDKKLLHLVQKMQSRLICDERKKKLKNVKVDAKKRKNSFLRDDMVMLAQTMGKNMVIKTDGDVIIGRHELIISFCECKDQTSLVGDHDLEVTLLSFLQEFGVGLKTYISSISDILGHEANIGGSIIDESGEASGLDKGRPEA